jgi:hypothetical protein
VGSGRRLCVLAIRRRAIMSQIRSLVILFVKKIQHGTQSQQGEDYRSCIFNCNCDIDRFALMTCEIPEM